MAGGFYAQHPVSAQLPGDAFECRLVFIGQLRAERVEVGADFTLQVFFVPLAFHHGVDHRRAQVVLARAVEHHECLARQYGRLTVYFHFGEEIKLLGPGVSGMLIISRMLSSAMSPPFMPR